MTTRPSADIDKASWMKNIHWPTSPPFRLRWVTKVEVPFWRIGHLNNPLNGGESVVVAKDGQEVGEECGRLLLREMEEFAAAFGPNSNKVPLPGSSRSRHHNNEQHGGGRRESDSQSSGFNPASWWNNKKKPHNHNHNSHWNSRHHNNDDKRGGGDGSHDMPSGR